MIQLDECVLREKGPQDVHLRILAVSGEHNVDHAALADTVNIAELRGGKIYPGNSALGEVLSVGSGVKRFKPGDIVITHCNGEPDIYGYPLRIWAYDQPDSIGWYGEEAVVGDWQILPAPLKCGLNLWEIAALPLRAPTAYHLWRRAIGIFRLKVSREKLARLNVLGFGGGVSELFLMLAQHEGHRALFCSGSPERRKHLEGLGIETIDQKGFHRFASPDDVKAFNKSVKGMTGGEGAHIVCDMMRGPVFAAGARRARALRRQRQQRLADRQEGVATTRPASRCGRSRSTTCTTRRSTAAAPRPRLYGSVFKPTVHSEIYRFEDLPRCFDELKRNVQTGIPIVQVARELPAAVKNLVPEPSARARARARLAQPGRRPCAFQTA